MAANKTTSDAPIKKTPAKKPLKNIYTSRVVVESTPSGTVYDVQPGARVLVKAEDADYLLSLKRKQGSGCCGGSAASDLSYFTEA